MGDLPRPNDPWVSSPIPSIMGGPNISSTRNLYTKWSPQNEIAKSVNITPKTMIYDIIDIYIYITSYNYSIHGVYKPTYNWGVPPCINLCRIARLPNHGLSAWHPRHTELRCPWAVPTTDHHFDDSSQRIYSTCIHCILIYIYIYIMVIRTYMH